MPARSRKGRLKPGTQMTSLQQADHQILEYLRRGDAPRSVQQEAAQRLLDYQREASSTSTLGFLAFGCGVLTGLLIWAFLGA